MKQQILTSIYSVDNQSGSFLCKCLVGYLPQSNVGHFSTIAKVLLFSLQLIFYVALQFIFNCNLIKWFLCNLFWFWSGWSLYNLITLIDLLELIQFDVGVVGSAKKKTALLHWRIIFHTKYKFCIPSKILFHGIHLSWVLGDVW